MGRPGGRRILAGVAGPPVSGQRVPATADHGPLTEVAVNAMQLGVREREQGGVACAGSAPALPRSQPTSVLERWCGHYAEG